MTTRVKLAACVSVFAFGVVMVVSSLFAACSSVAEPSLPKGPEAWLEFVEGNVRKDGLRLDLEALKDEIAGEWKEMKGEEQWQIR